ncbi:hypothetical protein [Paraburkholderia hayleyella]|uniref:hypothetical protein n=1 Tax=Paraburkholderia hayleyella TaxID=2152889 RepID=UPI0012923179|nr:hypothetical protein [Paraburkholderia hayleyella]
MESLVMSVVGILVVAVTFIVAIYGYAIPKYFPSFKTYSFLIYTAIASAAFCGYRIYVSIEAWRWSIAIVGSFILTILIYIISIFIIVNIRGA